MCSGEGGKDPALFLFLLVTATAGLSGLVPRALFPVDELPGVVLYVANLRLLAGGYLGGWGHIWSLAIEEQFYLVWPLLLVLVRCRWSTRAVMWMALTGAAALGAVSDPLNQDLWVFPLVAALTAATIIGVGDGERGGLGAGWLQHVGRGSYALYLWNLPAFWLTYGVVHRWVLALPFAVVVSFTAAEISWRLVERPATRSVGHRAAQASVPVPRADPPGVISSTA